MGRIFIFRENLDPTRSLVKMYTFAYATIFKVAKKLETFNVSSSLILVSNEKGFTR